MTALSRPLGLGAEVWRVLDKSHHIRNVAEYEGTLDVGERIVIAAAALGQRGKDALLGGSN